MKCTLIFFLGTTATLGTKDYKFPQSSSLNEAIHEGRSSSSRTISSSTDLFEGKICFFWSRLLKKWGTRFTMFLVLVIGFGFNFPRWFEWEMVYHPVEEHTSIPKDSQKLNSKMNENNETNDMDPSNESNYERIHHVLDDFNTQNITHQYLKNKEQEPALQVHIQPSSLSNNEQYFLHYQLIASCIVMILIPAAILLKVYCSFRKAITSRANKNKTHKIMLIIISMFVICHCPKVRIINFCSNFLLCFIIV